MPFDAILRPFLDAQEQVISRRQALEAGLSRRAIEYRLGSGHWRLVLPGVYLTTAGAPTRSQAQMAALFYAGDDSALDDVDACFLAGLRVPRLVAGRVFVVVPEGSRARSYGFVSVRRTSQELTWLYTGRRRRLPPAEALVAMSRRLPQDQLVLAAFSEAVQTRVVALNQLADAHRAGPPKHKAVAAAALEDLGVGVRSAPEGWFLHLATASLVLPPLLYNRLLRLPSGRLVSPDALAVEAGLIHETNGRRPHEREDLFESMQERHDVMTASGLIVLHNSPRRLRREGAAAIGEFEQCFLANVGRGLPPGVVLLPV